MADAKDIYISQSAVGNGDGTSAASAFGYTWFNNTSSWNDSAGTIQPGDTVHLVGVITNTLSVRGSGTPGNPITILFEPGAKLSQPAATLFNCQSVSNIVIDGGSGGVIENTDNGTSLGHQIAVSGIYASGSHDLEVENLTFRNFYVHASTNDSADLPFDSNGALYMNGFGNNISVHNCSFSNICWALNFQAGSGGGMNIYSNYFVNYDHGVAGLGNSYSNVNIYGNHFGSTASWDTTNDVWHHDGIHIFFGEGGTISNVKIYNNLFDGNWGINNTAHIYCEGDYTHNNRQEMQYFTIYNNVFIQYANNYLNNGFIACHGINLAFYNNTFIGSGVNLSSGVTIGTNANVTFANNLLTGVNTFVSLNTNNFDTFENNIYANQAAGGNSAFSVNGTSSNFSSWQSAVGDSKSIFKTASVVDSDGTLPVNSIAIGAGENLSAFFTTDIAGNPRPLTGAWDIGAYAYEFIASPANLHPIQGK